MVWLLAMAGFLGRFEALLSWSCGEVFDLGSSCTQRSLIDVFNIVYVVVYFLYLLLNSVRRPRQQFCKTNGSRSWDVLLLSACCAATGFAYAVTAICSMFTWFDQKVWVVSLIRGFVWIALSLSLNVHPSKFAQILVLFWWVAFCLLISAFNFRVLFEKDGLQTLEVISWIVNLSLLLYTLKLIISNLLRNRSPPDKFSEEPLLIGISERKAKSVRDKILPQLAFTWLNSLLRLGNSKPLTLEDVPALNPGDGSFLAHKVFSEKFDLERKNKSRTKNLVLFAFARCYLKEMILVGIFALVKTASVLLSPILLYAFVQYSNRETEDLHWGLSIVGFLLATKIAESLSQRHWFFISRRYGMRMRSAVMAMVFEKSLKISSSGRRRHATGEIVNYIAADAYRLGEFPWWLHTAWSLPIQLLFSMVILFATVGLGALFGLVPLVLCGLLNIPFTKMLQDYQPKFMAAQDERLRSTSAVLNNMKIIKLHSVGVLPRNESNQEYCFCEVL